MASMLDTAPDTAPEGLLRVNRGTDANRLHDLLTFMSNSILKSGKEIFLIRKPLKLNVPFWNKPAMKSILISGCMLTGKLPRTLMHVVIIPLLKFKSKDPADVNNYRPIAIATALFKVLEMVLLSRFARYLWTADS